MSEKRRHTENTEIRLDKKVEAKMKREKEKTKKRKNSKFRNSKFGQKWFALKKWQRVTVWVVIALVLLSLIAFFTVYGIFSKFQNKVDEGNLGINSAIEDKYGETEIFNIALFGVDTRDENSFKGRSDTIIIASVDKNAGTIKLTSILRDSYVPIEGHKNQKITHAYMFGGPELAIKTINQNFHMNITDYVTVNFFKLADAVDVLGGVDVEITEAQRKHINDIGDDDDESFPYLDHSGMVHLNGKQTVIYARIRHLDSDAKRAERQKEVLEQLIAKAKQISPAKYGEMVKVGLSLCETSMSFSEIMSFAPMLSKEISLSSRVIPSEPENPTGGMYEGAWVWRYDLDLAATHIHEFIYGEPPAEPIQTNKNDKKPSNSKNESKTTKPSSNNKKPNGNKPQNPSSTTTKPHEVNTTVPPKPTDPTPTTTSPQEVTTKPPKPTDPTPTKPPEPESTQKPDTSEKPAQ